MRQQPQNFPHADWPVCPRLPETKANVCESAVDKSVVVGLQPLTAFHLIDTTTPIRELLQRVPKETNTMRAGLYTAASDDE